MLNVFCVLRSGGIYDAEWVRKLRSGVGRHLGAHVFKCLSDVEVPCERIPLEHNWPRWWSKIELFRPGVIQGPSLYLDLDVVVLDDMNGIRNMDCDFAMMKSVWVEDMVNSSMMWFSGDNVPHHVYEKFARQPTAFMKHHERNADGPYVGDQAFIWDCMDREVEFINDRFDRIKSYKIHCAKGVPKNTSIVCFHGTPRPSEVEDEWVKANWR